MSIPDGALIEIIEHTDSPEPGHIVPNEIRINGSPVLAPADHPVIVHEITMRGDEPVQVTLTLFARRVVIGSEAKGGE